MAILTQGRMAVHHHGGEDWRGLMATAIREAGTAPVLIPGSFSEAHDFASIEDPKLRDVLFSPQLVYGQPSGTIRLPIDLLDLDTDNMTRVLRRIENEPRFYLLMTESGHEALEFWLRGKLGPRCTTSPVAGSIGLRRFTCTPHL